MSSHPGSHFKNGLRLYEGPRGSAWYYKFKFKGETYHGSCDTTDPRKAKAFLEELKTELRTKARRQEWTRLSLPLLSAIWADWYELNQGLGSQKHTDRVKSMWTLHLEPALGHLPLDRIDTKIVEKSRADYLGTHSPGGANTFLKILDSLFGFAIRRGVLVAKPYKVQKLRVQRIPRPVLVAEVITVFFAEVDRSRNPNVKGIIRMMVGLGLREAEAIGARWEWADFHRNTYTPGKTKGKEAVAIPMPEWLTSFLVALPQKANEGIIFPAEDGLPHRTSYTRKAVLRGATKCGLHHLSPHRLRASFASIHAEIGTPIVHIQKMLRHKAIVTTMRYVEDGAASTGHDEQAAVAERMGLGPAKPKNPAKPKASKAKGGKIGGKTKVTQKKGK